MKACSNYIAKQRRECVLPHFPYSPLTVVIPCYDEPNIIDTLASLWNCTNYHHRLHVVVVLNHAVHSSKEVMIQNEQTEIQLQKWRQSYATCLRVLSVLRIVFPENEDGVGAARKMGMDEVVNQYVLNNKEGIIVSLDADTTVAPNYLSEIFEHYQKYPKTNTLIIRYEHQLPSLNPEQKNAMLQYELYLRYMTLSYRYVQHPDAFHTIGSAFAVKASAYCKQGGMNRRQAGEDFYFLQKMLLLGNASELNTSCVYPSARTSNRVPFGTGRAVEELMHGNRELQTYSFQAFQELKVLFDKHLSLYKITKADFEELLYNKLGGLIKSWLIEVNFFMELQQINNNCGSETMFSKKFFESFSIFQIIKYLNFTHTHFLQKVSVFHAIACLPEVEDLMFDSPDELLQTLRNKMSVETFTKK